MVCAKWISLIHGLSKGALPKAILISIVCLLYIHVSHSVTEVHVWADSPDLEYYRSVI